MANSDIHVDAVDGRPVQEKVIGVSPALTNLNDGGVTSWLWEEVFAPSGSVAAFSNSAIAAPTYGPLNVAGTYHLRLSVNGATGPWESDAEVDEIVIAVPPIVGDPIYIPAVGETTQRGTQGWAAELRGMNHTLALLAAARTMQAAYDVSTPPRITIDPAKGPIEYYRLDASPGDVLIIGDDVTANRFQFRSRGHLAQRANLSVAGDTALELISDAGHHADTYLLRLTDSAACAGLYLRTHGHMHLCTSGATADGPHCEIDAAPNYMLFVESLTAVNPTYMLLDPTGALRLLSDLAAPYGLDLNARTPTTGLARFRDGLGSGGDPLDFAVENDGGIVSHSKGANVGLSLDAKASVSFVFFLQDSTGTGRISMEGDGQMLWSGTLGAGEEALKFLPSGLVVDSAILEVSDGLNPGWALYGDGSLFHMPEELIANPAASLIWYHLDLTRMMSVLNGETRRGVFVDGSAVTVNAGGELINFDSQINVNNGIAKCYRAKPADQDATPAYACETLAGNPFYAFDRFCVSDIGLHNWIGAQNLTEADAAPACSITAGNATLYIVVPVHVPHGVTIEALSVHVNAGAAGIQAWLIHTDATDGVNADRQTQVAATNAAVAGGEQDLVQTAIAEVVPKQGAAVQYAYSVVIRSGNAADVFYSGHVKYSYNEILKGD